MAIKFGGEFEVKRKPEEVYDFLTDPNKFAPLLPDFQGLTVQDATQSHRAWLDAARMGMESVDRGTR